MKNEITKQQAEELLAGKLTRYFGVPLAQATNEQIYKAVALSVRDLLLQKRKTFNEQTRKKGEKKVYYLCMEFLVGRSLKNNLFNLGLDQIYAEILAKSGINLEELYDFEPDAGLGNGGLGRLAACFLDALATGNYPAMGFSIRYEYGLFKQKIVDGWQTELPDNWLPGGEVWLVQRTDKVFRVKFDGHIEEKWTENGLQTKYVSPNTVDAVAYDMMMSGANSEAVSVLRLWRPINSHKFDMQSFSQGDYIKALMESNEAELLGKVLYPADNHFEGKSLRLKQQYLLVSASLQNIVADHKKYYGSLKNFAEKTAIHINDTHPALAIAELMRIFVDENGFGWDEAFNIVCKTCAYTNHTVLAEALETWQSDLIERRLPRIHRIISEINKRFCEGLWHKFPGDWEKIKRMSIIAHDQIRMANLSIVGSHKVNGVSALHSDIIKESIFKDFHDDTPGKFTNVTNGIAHRRWLCQSNPELTELLKECIGEKFVYDAQELKKFEKFANDKSVLGRLNEIKLIKKRQFADYFKKRAGIIINPNTVFNVQAKRLHEYKRQLLNLLNIIDTYNLLLENPNLDIVPQTYIFGAKAAPGYYIAKEVIKLANFISSDISEKPKLREKLDVVFAEDYCVSMAEHLMPATEISQQISLAGKEASGTGNMKFMINGAITLGTMDGANVEIAEAAGSENIEIIGMTNEEVNQHWRRGYSPGSYYMGNERIRKTLDRLTTGFDGESFGHIAKYLLTEGIVPDPYMCLADFGSYQQGTKNLLQKYQNQEKWARMSLYNIANAGIFSADRSIADYANNIWNIKPQKRIKQIDFFDGNLDID